MKIASSIFALSLSMMFGPCASSQVNNPSVNYVQSAPSGHCVSSPPIDIVVTTGSIYTCTGGQWEQSGGGGGGAVDSVNGQTGAVNLTATSVGADPTGSAITAQTAAEAASIPLSQKGANNGVGTLDATGNIPLSELANVPASALPAATAAGQALVSTGAGNTYTAQAISGTLPAATAAGQVPVAAGSGSTYAARALTATDVGAMATGATVTAAQLPTQINPVTSNSVNDVFYASGYPSAGCTVGGTTYTEQVSCAFYSALAAATTGTKTVTLRLGVKAYPTSVMLEEPANTQVGVSIVGEGQGQTNSPTNDQSVIYATAAMPSVIMHDDMPKTGGLTGNLRFEGFTVDGNNLATDCMDMYGMKQSYYHNLIIRRCTSTAQWVSFGHRGAPSGDYVEGFQNDVDGLFLVGDGAGQTSWATTTVTQTGGVPSATVSAGGTYVYQHPPAYLLGYGTGRTPCTTMGTVTAATTANAGKFNVTGVTFSGFSGCTGTMYLSIPDIPPAQLGVSINDTDSSYTRIRVQSVGQVAGDSDGGGDNTHYGEHNYGMPVGIQDFTRNRWYGLEFDSDSQFGFDLESASQIYGASSFWNSSYPFAADFKMGTNSYGAIITGHVCNNNQTAGNYAQFVGAGGPILDGATSPAFPGGLELNADAECGAGYQVVNSHNGSQWQFGQINMEFLLAPTATVAPQTTGTTTYTYEVRARTADGSFSAASAAVTTTTGATTPNNLISWNGITGAAGYDVFCIAGCSTLGKLNAAPIAPNNTSYTDTTGVGDASTINAANTNSRICYSNQLICIGMNNTGGHIVYTNNVGTASYLDVNSSTVSTTLPFAAKYTSGTTGTLASAATIAPTSEVTHVTGTTSIATITPPANFSGGCLTLIADGILSFLTSGNITTPITGIAGGVAYQACYDGSKWYLK